MNVQLCRTIVNHIIFRQAGVVGSCARHKQWWQLETWYDTDSHEKIHSGEEKAGGGKVESDNPAHAQTTAKVGIACIILLLTILHLHDVAFYV
jgi:hypothetical protein